MKRSRAATSNPGTTGSGGAQLAAQRPSAVRKFIVGLGGVLLAWLVVLHSLVAHLAETDPALALRLASGHPVALANLAQQRLVTPNPTVAATDAGSPVAVSAVHAPRIEDNGILAEIPVAELPELRARIERALAANPMSAMSIRMLGQLADLEGDREKASRLLEVAARRSKHESMAVYLMIRRNLDVKNWEAAMFYADLAIRSRPDLMAAVTPLLVRMAETPDANPVLKAALADDPAWRTAFFSDMLRHVTHTGTPLDLLVHLKTSKRPPANDEMKAYLGLLVQANHLSAAYFARLQLMTPEQLAGAGFVLNGNFQQPSGELPFDWVLPKPVGATVEIARVPGDSENRALRIEFGSSRVQLGEIQQRLMLPPGTYRLTARFRGEILGRRGMKLIVSCASTPVADQLGESPAFLGNQAAWRAKDFVFTVRDTCISQMLRIRHDARFASEQFASGVVWYDDIHIARVDAADTPAPARASPSATTGQ